jgi:hypothetical protein
VWTRLGFATPTPTVHTTNGNDSPNATSHASDAVYVNNGRKETATDYPMKQKLAIMAQVYVRNIAPACLDHYAPCILQPLRPYTCTCVLARVVGTGCMCACARVRVRVCVWGVWWVFVGSG